MMDNLDRLIAKALAEDEDAPVDPGYFALALSAFGGRAGWVSWVLMAVQSGMFLAGIWAGWHFFAATDPLPAIKWGISAATLLVMATQLKMALMPVLQANRVLLAIRRLELRLMQR